MKKMITVLSLALALVVGCNNSPDGPTYGTDAGPVVGDAHVAPAADACATCTTPVAPRDSGPISVADSGPSPTAWRHCGTDGISPIEFRIQVIDAAGGPLGACAAGWDPIAYALPVSGDIHVVGEDIHQSVRPEWAGREVDFNFICGSDGRYATIAAGSHPSDVNVHVGVLMSTGGLWQDVSPSVTAAVSPSGGTLMRLSLCSTILGI